MQLNSPTDNLKTEEQDFGQTCLAVNQIMPNPLQPRLAMNDQKLIALAENIKSVGVLEPVLVCPQNEEQQYVLIAGHRRLAASILAGLNLIPARILPAQTFGFLGTAVTENMLREDLGVIEVAMALGKLSGFGVDRKTLCSYSGLASSSVSELIRIAKIPQEVSMECVKNGDTKKRFLIELSRFDNEHEIIDAYRYYLEHKELPQRKRRDYSAVSSDMKNEKLLKLLREVNKCFRNTDVDYSEENEFGDMLRMEMVRFQVIAKKRGWFLPRKFGVSNSIEIDF